MNYKLCELLEQV